MKIKLRQDFVIPAGTIFDDCSGLTVNYVDENYETILGTGKDGVINVFIDKGVISDKPDVFELME